MRTKYARLMFIAIALSAAQMGGCPNNNGGSGVSPVIGISTTQGTAPLRVSVTAADSTSTNGAIAAVRWDFAGLGTADTSDASFTFTAPGRYVITLTVEDATGATSNETAEVRVRGTAADAVIVADRTDGPAPLAVAFDGTQSSAPDDTIFDYFWDFGDGSTARVAKPVHTFTAAGEYSVSLRVVTGGGVEDRATLTVSVGQSTRASLQFNGTQFATLPSGATGPLAAFTFETYVKPQADGGVIVSFGTPVVSFEIAPGSNLLRVRAGGQAFEGSTISTAGRWNFVALSYDATGGFTAYLDGQQVLTAALTGNITIDSLSLGAGLRGNATRARLWSTVRTAAQIATDANSSPAQNDSALLGDWLIREGTGQTLFNRKQLGTNGTLGGSGAVESSDPAWSSDAP